MTKPSIKLQRRLDRRMAAFKRDHEPTNAKQGKRVFTAPGSRKK